MMKLKLTIALLLFCGSASYSQNYLITETLPLDDSNAFTSLQYGRKDFGYGLVNSKGIMAWEVSSPGFPVGMGKFHNNVIVFYTTDNPLMKSMKDIHAAVVDLKTHKISKDKEVFTTENKYVFIPFILNDPARNFNWLLIRTTYLKRGISGYTIGWQDKFNQTSQLNGVYLDENLTIKTKDIKSAALQSNFMSICAGSNNNWYLCSYANDQLTVERFDGDNNLKSKLVTPTSIRNNSQFYPLMKYDTLPGNCIDETVAYKNAHKDNVMRSFRFDFNDQKSYSTGETVLDKDYEKTLEKGNDGKKISNFKSIDELYPVKILETKERVIVLKEIQYSFTPSGSNAEQFWRSGSLISVYTKKDLSPERDIVIDKDFGTFILGGTDIESYVKDNKLYTVTCELSSPGKFKTYLYISDLQDGSTQKKELERDDAGKGWTTYAPTVCWFKNNFITPFTAGSASVHLKFETALQSVSY